MIHIALQSEYSFQKCYYNLEKLVLDAVERGDKAVGVADTNNTYSHILLEKLCKENNIKPIFGVRLIATKTVIKARSARKSMDQQIEVILLAKNNNGLIDIYKAIDLTYKQFYYFPRLLYSNILELSDDVVVIGSHQPSDSKLIAHRFDFYSLRLGEGLPAISYENRVEKPYIAIPYIAWPKRQDQGIYEVLSNSKGTNIPQKGGYIMEDWQLLAEGMPKEAINNANELAEKLNAKIQKAEMVRFNKKLDLKTECLKGALKLGTNLDDPRYMDRLNKEVKIINQRSFTDYFFIVSDMLKKARDFCLVGPGRGSSGGSLVCFLLEITTIDPIKYGLIFERFVDLNRIGLPDIDTDIPDTSRQKVIKYLEKRYSSNNVKSIGVVTTFKPKSAINDVAKALAIPQYDIKELKDSIIERQGGDDRASMRIIDTFDKTDIGKKTLKKYPQLRIAEKLEGHAKNSGKHAAGVIISNEPLYNFCGINDRDFTLMTTGKLAESIGLLKIDVLGLRTLSVLEDTAKLAGFDYHDFYTLSLNDPNVFKIFNDDRVYGVFQFEGAATRNLTRQIEVKSFNDLCSLTALSRPGALISGEAGRYVKCKNENDSPKYYGEIFKEITESTYGSVVFQEQGMDLMRRYAGMSWTNVNILRQAISKSYGIEFFMKYERIFKDGATALGHPTEEINGVWNTIASMGSYSFNKSHAVGYSYISYWCAYCKAYYPLEFAAANMNHAKDSNNAIRILRDIVINDNIEYCPIDADKSEINWTIHDRKLLGGLTNLDGIGIKKAQTIIKSRNNRIPYTPAIAKKLLNPITPFDILFPAKHYFGDYYKNPIKYGLDFIVSNINELNDPDTYIIIGKIILKDLVFRNTPQLVMKRGGQLVNDNLYYLKLIIEDDTADIMCQIPPFRFDELNGKHLAESLVEDKTWVIIQGSIRDNYRMISIEKIGVLKHN